MLKNKSTKKKVNKELLRRPDIYVAALSNKEELTQARTATTGEKFNTLDERIDCEVDRLNKKIDVTMLQQEDKENHTIENTVDGMSTDMVVKGRTLQNVMPELNKSNFNFTGETNLVDGFFIIPFGVDVNASLIGVNRKKTILKPNTKYTVIADILENNTGQKLGMSSYGCSFVPSKNSFDNSVGISMITGTTKDNFNDVEIKTDFLFCIWGNGGDLSKKIKFKAMILEGDWTNKPLPQYFEGIKSFGQEEDKISILSNGKNLVDLKNVLDNEKINYTISEGAYFFTTDVKLFNNGVFKPKNANQIALSCKIKLGTCTNTRFDIVYEDGTIKSSNFATSNLGFSDISVISDISKKVSYIRMNWSSVGTIYLKDLQIEEGTQATIYEPYKQDKKDILLQDLGFDEGLRGLNDTIYDELNDIKNVAIKRIEKYKFLGTEQISLNGKNNNTIEFVINIPSLNIKNSSKLICNNLINIDSGDKRGIRISINGKIVIHLLKTELASEDVAGCKSFLETNPTTIYYELAEPVETPLDENIGIKTFEEKTYISFENAISGTSSFKAPVDSAATISRLNRENRALEEENKNLRQDFESTTLVLTDSDLELVKQNVDMDFRLMEVEFALDIPQAILSSNIKFKNKKGEVKSMARTPYEMMKIVILSGDYDREDYMHKVGKYYERGRMTKEEHDELMSLMTADEVISK